MSANNVKPWKFVDGRGSFILQNPHEIGYLYFPLVNEAGMMSVVTPLLHGDIKTGQNSFLTIPVSVEDLHQNCYARNFWLHIEGFGAWSITGNSARQISRRYTSDNEETVFMEAGFFWHRITRDNEQVGLSCRVTNFVPMTDDRVELMLVSVSNTSPEPKTITPTAAIPIYARSADNIRDHRHVTSLLQRISCHAHGISVTPTLSFDERGHTRNDLSYYVLGIDADDAVPVGYFPFLKDFVGEGGSLDWPKAVVLSQEPEHFKGSFCEGYEAMGGIHFQKGTLNPGETRSFLLILAVSKENDSPDRLLQKYGGVEKFKATLTGTKAAWQERLDKLSFHTGDSQFDLWLRWVTSQPILRRLFGNSFLPYHDYGRGGRGWRDLWQDILTLIYMEPDRVEESLVNHFAGVRFDGSNATIIGKEPGEFIADRNNIPRVWMDHGAWPWMSLKLYIDQTGDLSVLLSEQTYFKDAFVFRAGKTDDSWTPQHGTLLLQEDDEPYLGSLLEHLLVQHLTVFYNVGEHNIIRLEGGDWNDGLDMAAERGESAAFSALYASNLKEIAEIVMSLNQAGVKDLKIAEELLILLDAPGESEDYDDMPAKGKRLDTFFTRVSSKISGEKALISTQSLADDLRAKANWMVAHLRSQEWISNRENYSWFNGYYDNDGGQVEGDHPNGVRMTLTGQVFTTMGGIATSDQAAEILRSAKRYLFDPNVGGYRLNTNFNEVLLNFGRCFGFAYGHKENGAMFCHIAVMYANALYRQGFVQDGDEILKGIYEQSADFKTSRMYPGIPEYFSPRGRGMYPYLTGSASWYLLTMTNQVFGVQGTLGDLLLAPKLLARQFDAEGQASITTSFAGRKIRVLYRNPEQLDFGDYRFESIHLNGEKLHINTGGNKVIIERNVITALDPKSVHKVEVVLTQKNH
jgi:cellobiose phosphorylase